MMSESSEDRHITGPSTDHQTKALRVTTAIALHYRGPFRVYFNRKEEAPRLISIDNGSHAWEIVCKSVEIAPALKSKIDINAEYPNPIFALEGYGDVTVDGNGAAKIT